MFKVGKAVVTRSAGVCKIIAVENHDFGIGEQPYFVLTPLFPKNANATKTFVPESKAEMSLRPVVKKADVLKIINSMPSIEKIWYSDPKIRRTKFEEIYKSGDLLKICQIIKSLFLQKEELKTNKRTLSMLDHEFLLKLRNDINEEFAVALKITPAEVDKMISEKMEV